MATAGLRQRRGGRRAGQSDPAMEFTVEETIIASECDNGDPTELPADFAWCASWAIAWLREQSVRMSSQPRHAEIDHGVEKVHLN